MGSNEMNIIRVVLLPSTFGWHQCSLLLLFLPFQSLLLVVYQDIQIGLGPGLEFSELDPRVAVGSFVELERDPRSTVLVDLSNRGCRLQTTANLTVGDPVEFTIPENDQVWCGQGPLTLHGTVRRLVCEPGDDRSMLAVLFDAEMPEQDRTRLTALINHWASGPQALDAAVVAGAPAIPATQLPSVPDLTLDDETDPPILAGSEVAVELGEGSGSNEPTEDDPRDRRVHDRA